ncbi:hypothetical protein D5F11_016275 [Siminovitchia terrae]|uniref:Uncharacterized protein n=1 Tax=Siminovitchia terrae TaxID=1914933 RepID=A0A429X5L0_SIMTE|nr:hypothetical protein [Siminovitchia terrae]RST58590.1 hypothetical protein D5F11_016275 [Siminovitchia terrae]
MDRNNEELYIELIGLNTLLLLSKELFARNNDIKDYIESIFKLEFKNYLYMSRTLLVARVNRHIYSLNYNDAKERLEAVKQYRQNSSDETKVEKPNKSNKSSKDNFKKWLENI